ncbi:MAG: helix-turn-helix transcriptional regulator [Bacteroidota bacterium]
MERLILVSLISSSGLGISSFFSIYLLKKPSLHNKLLALLLLALSLRITKSIFYSTVDLPLFVRNLGLAANLTLGPLLFLYAKALLGAKEIKKVEYLHFAPAMVYLVGCAVLPNGGDSLFWKVSYSLILMQSFVYVLLTAFRLKNQGGATAQPASRWLVGLILCLTIMWGVYALIFMQVIPVYALGPITFSLLMYCLLAVGIENREVFFPRKAPKYGSANLTDDEGRRQLQALRQRMATDKLYKNPTLTVAEVSEALGTSARNVSLIINKYGQSNFSTFVNAYRVEEAKRLLVTQEKEKILAIAYEAGFKNLATFNQVFKTVTGLTPSAYRKNQPVSAG